MPALQRLPRLFMNLIVCPFSLVEPLVAERAPERVVSLLDPDRPSPYLGPAYAERHLRLSFHDVHVATWEEEPPTVEQVAQLVDFVLGASRRSPILIHCRAGIGRSPAAAFVAACALAPRVDEVELAQALRVAAPFVRPNEVLVRHGDAVLGREGRMLRALEATRPAESGAFLEPGRVGTPFELLLPGYERTPG